MSQTSTCVTLKFFKEVQKRYLILMTWVVQAEQYPVNWEPLVFHCVVFTFPSSDWRGLFFKILLIFVPKWYPVDFLLDLSVTVFSADTISQNFYFEKQKTQNFLWQRTVKSSLTMRAWRQKLPLVNMLATEIQLSVRNEGSIYGAGTCLGLSPRRKVFSLRNNCPTMIFTVSTVY